MLHQIQTPAIAEHAAVPQRRKRADARRNVHAVVEAAKSSFAASGVDAPMREIAAGAGVGVGTIYRHFPQRSDLIAAVFRHEVDACADAAAGIAAEYTPGEAVARWLARYTDFIATKRGLAAALHSGDPAYDALPNYFMGTLAPVLDDLLEAAAAAGETSGDVRAPDLLTAVSNLCLPTRLDDADHSQRMVSLLVDGLRYGAAPRAPGEPHENAEAPRVTGADGA